MCLSGSGTSEIAGENGFYLSVKSRQALPPSRTINCYRGGAWLHSSQWKRLFFHLLPHTFNVFCQCAPGNGAVGSFEVLLMLPNDNNDGNSHVNNANNKGSSGWGACFCEHLFRIINEKIPKGQFDSSSLILFCFSWSLVDHLNKVLW